MNPGRFLPGNRAGAGCRDAQISIRAGIAENGIDALRLPYPKLVPFDTTISLLPNRTSAFQPRVRYLNSAQFVQWKISTEGSVSLESIQNGAPIRISIAGDPNVLDEPPAWWTLTLRNPVSNLPPAIHSVTDIGIPYIEMNYRCAMWNSPSESLSVQTGGTVSFNFVTTDRRPPGKKFTWNVADLGGVQTDATGYPLG